MVSVLKRRDASIEPLAVNKFDHKTNYFNNVGLDFGFFNISRSFMFEFFSYVLPNIILFICVCSFAIYIEFLWSNNVYL